MDVFRRKTPRFAYGKTASLIADHLQLIIVNIFSPPQCDKNHIRKMVLSNHR